MVSSINCYPATGSSHYACSVRLDLHCSHAVNFRLSWIFPSIIKTCLKIKLVPRTAILLYLWSIQMKTSEYCHRKRSVWRCSPLCSTPPSCPLAQSPTRQTSAPATGSRQQPSPLNWKMSIHPLNTTALGNAERRLQFHQVNGHWSSSESNGQFEPSPQSTDTPWWHQASPSSSECTSICKHTQYSMQLHKCILNITLTDVSQNT